MNRSSLREALVLGFALVFPLFMAWVYFVALAGDGQTVNPAGRAAYAAGKVFQFALPVGYVFLFSRADLRPNRPTSGGLLLGVAFAGLVAVGMFAIYFGGLNHDKKVLAAAPLIHNKLREFGLDSPGGFVAMALFLSVIHSLGEEYYWRWFVFGRLRQLVPVGAAVGLSSLGFMAHHVIILATYFPSEFWRLVGPCSLGVAIGGAAWAWVYHRSGSLYAAWLSHALIDLAIMAVGYDMLRPGWAS